MTILAIVPTPREFEALVGVFSETGVETLERTIGRVSALECYGGSLLVSQGGLGKAQTALVTQHIIDHWEGISLVVCAGTAGALLDAGNRCRDSIWSCVLLGLIYGDAAQ